MNQTTLDMIFLGFIFIGGFGMFIYGMNTMAEGLQKAAGNKMKSLLGALTNNRLIGILVGTVVTSIIQSSSAVTVMIVGFVNAGLMNLTQAVGVIMGANIGTTVTSWIVSSSEWFAILKPDKLAPLAIGIGAIILFFSENEKKKQFAEIIVGFGLLFVGLEMMSDAILPFRDSKVFSNAFLILGKNPFLGILAGAIITAIVQSSSVSVSILQILAMQALVPWNAAVYIILGQNIGTCATSLLSSIGASKTAKRAAVIHLLFNMIGTIIFSIGCILFFHFINVEVGNQLISSTQISIFHSIFNLSTTVLLFGFADHIVTLSGKIVRGDDEDENDEGAIALRHLDNRILETPSFAVENAIKEVVHMGELATANLRLSIESLLEKDQKKIETVFKKEKDINILDNLITNYLIKISQTALNEHQNRIITNLFHTVSDIERIGDHAENIAEFAQYYMENKLTFSDVAHEEMKDIAERTIQTVEYAIEARRSDNIELVEEVKKYEEMVDVLEKELRVKHIKRLSTNLCDSKTGVVFLDTISNLERISDHAFNIARYIRDEAF